VQIVPSRDAADQGLRVGVARAVEYRLDRPVFHRAPGIHHHDLVAGLGHHAHVMGDQHQRQIALFDQIVEQADDLRLHRDIQRRGRLIRDQDIGVGGQRHGDHDTLLHARPTSGADSGRRSAVVRECATYRGFRPCARAPGLRHPEMQFRHVIDLRPDLLKGIERGHRVLRDQPDPPPRSLR
jgi:hypothetical protein